MIERETALESFLPRSLLGRAHEKLFRRRIEGLLRLRSWMADASTSSTSSAGAGPGTTGPGLNGNGPGVAASEQQAPLAFLGLSERDLLSCVSPHADFFLAAQTNHLLLSSRTAATSSGKQSDSGKHARSAAANSTSESSAAAILASSVFSEIQVL